MCFPAIPSPNEICHAHQATETRAKCWTLSQEKTEEEDLCEGQLSGKIKAIVSTPPDDSLPIGDLTHVVGPQESALRGASSSPAMYLITSRGDPFKPGCPIQISNHRPGTADFDSLNKLLGVDKHSFGMYTTLRPQCSIHHEYDESLMHLKAIGWSTLRRYA